MNQEEILTARSANFQANPDQFATFLTAMLMVEQDTQKTYLQRNQQLHSLMDPFINWVPTQDFRGEIV